MQPSPSRNIRTERGPGNGLGMIITPREASENPPSEQPLQTRLVMPPVRSPVIDRPRLFQILNRGQASALTLVSAPPGFGKTTLITAWLTSINRRVVWFSLDPGDNDPVQFFQYLIRAFQQVAPDIGKLTGQLLQSPQIPPITTLLVPLINDLTSCAKALILVLEDYHAITARPVHDAVNFLLEHLPSSLRVVMITRTEPPLPLARLRVRNQLTEIRERDLRFTLEECHAFFTAVMALSLDPEAVQKLATRTEGWIAGLQLAALTLKEPDIDRQTYLAEFDGMDRQIVDYLLSEVLNHQPPVVRLFLRQTSVLDRLSAPLCVAVTGNPASAAMLETLEHANLFLFPLDGKRTWYRYHSLFGDMLRGTLTAEEQALYHQRAADWFDGQHLGAEAVSHALRAAHLTGDFADAMRLIQIHIDTNFDAGRIATVLGWLDGLPDLLVRQTAALAIRKAAVLSLTDQNALAEAYIAPFIGKDTTLPPDVVARRYFVESLLALARSKPVEAIAYAENALAHLPTGNSFWYTAGWWILAEAKERSAPIAEAIVVLRHASRSAQQAGRSVLGAMLDASLASALDLRGKHREALAVCNEALARFTNDRGELSPVAAVLMVRTTLLYYETDDRENALRALSQAKALVDQLGSNILNTALSGLDAMLSAADRHLDNALADARQTLTQAAQNSIADTTWIRALEANILIRQGDLASARYVLADVPAHAAFSYLHLDLYMAYVRLLLSQQQTAEAMHWLAQLEGFIRERGYWRYLITIRLLQARCAPDSPLVYLTEAVELAAPEGYFRLFLDEDGEIFKYLGQARSTAPGFVDTLVQRYRASGEAPIESLSERELEILRMVAQGLSNAEIAERLVLSVGTVKQHINHIYGKLDVRSRTQAIVKGQSLGLF